MRKVMFALCVLVSAAHADGGSRIGPDLYRLPDGSTVETVSCTATVPKDGGLVLLPGKRRFIVVLDRDGQEEGQCQVLDRPRPVVVVRHAPVVHLRVAFK